MTQHAITTHPDARHRDVVFGSSPWGYVRIERCGNLIAKIEFTDTAPKLSPEATAIVTSAIKGTLPVEILAPQGTEFQTSVWQALLSIPRGETRTYAQIAAQIGRPRAVRATANAIGANPIAIAIPCHRVLPAAGGIGGYRWGSHIKEQLLRLER